MASPDIVVVDSYSTTAFKDIPRSTREFPRSASMPNINEVFIHEIVDTILSSWCSGPASFLNKSPKSESSISLSIKVLKAQFFQLMHRLRALESENRSLRLSNQVLESEVRANTHELSDLRADYSCSIAEQKKLALASKQDHQKIRALMSDVDNAQNFIMAMIDINLHESFLEEAASSTIKNKQDAELALIKAIAQAADTKNSVWSRIIPFIARVRGRGTYVSAINLALQSMTTSREQDNPLEVSHATNSLPDVQVARPSSGRVGRSQHTAKGKQILSLDSAPSIPSELTAFVQFRGSRTRVDHEVSTQAPEMFGKEDILEQSPSEGLIPPPFQPGSNSGRTSNVDKRKGLIIIEDAELLPAHIDLYTTAAFHDLCFVGTGHGNLEIDPVVQTMGYSAPQTDISKNSSTLAVTVESSKLCLSALESLERICGTLSSSDLGSLEMTVGDDQSESDIGKTGHPSEKEPDITQVRNLPTPSTNEMIATQRRSLLDAVSSFFMSDIVLGSVAPRSTLPRSTPLVDGVAHAETESSDSETMIEVSSSHPVNLKVRPDESINQELPAYVGTSRASLDPFKLPIVPRRRGCPGNTPLSQQVSRRQSGSPNIPDSSFCHGSVTPSPAPISTISCNATCHNTVRTCAPSSEPLRRHSRDSLSISSTVTAKGPNLLATTKKKASISKPTTIFQLEHSKIPTDAHGAVSSGSEPQSFPLRVSKISTGRSLLRRMSNIPGSLSKSRQAISPEAPGLHMLQQGTPTSFSRKSQNSSLQNATSTPSGPSARNPTAMVAMRNVNANLTPPKVKLARNATTKTKSNTINSYSPMKRSPLSQNVITAPSDLGLKFNPRHAGNSKHSERSDENRPTLGTKSAIPKAHVKKSANASTTLANADVSLPPTAAFMKPASHPSTKTTRRMTNSVKPLIPTWTTEKSTPAQCRDMFRNSLSMVVR